MTYLSTPSVGESLLHPRRYSGAISMNRCQYTLSWVSPFVSLMTSLSHYFSLYVRVFWTVTSWMISNRARMHFCLGLTAYGYLVIIMWPHSPELSRSEEEGFGAKTVPDSFLTANSGCGRTATDVLTGLVSLALCLEFQHPQSSNEATPLIHIGSSRTPLRHKGCPSSDHNVSEDILHILDPGFPQSLLGVLTDCAVSHFRRILVLALHLRNIRRGIHNEGHNVGTASVTPCLVLR